MVGKHHIIVETAHLKYEFDVRRNICILRQPANLFAEQNDREAVFIGREAEPNGQILSIT